MAKRNEEGGQELFQKTINNAPLPTMCNQVSIYVLCAS